MKKSNRTIAGLRKNAESAFSNYTGGRREEFIGMEGRRSHMDGSVSVNPDQEEILIDILNYDTVTLAAPLFSANEGYEAPFNGSLDIYGTASSVGKGIVIQPQNLTLNELRKKAETAPFTIMGIRYDFGDDLQLKQDWMIRYKEGASITTKPYYPQTKRNLGNNIATALDDASFTQLVDAKTTLFIKVAPALSAETPRRVQLMLRVGTSIDITKALKNQSVVVKNGVTGGIGF